MDLLLKKGLITEQEAQKVKAEAEAMRTNAPAALPAESKWKISNGIKSVELFGDIRVRYEDRSAESPEAPKLKSGKIDLQRARYAVRLGLRGEVFDDFYYGLRLETAANPRSPWVTAGTSSSGAPYQGPFGKSTAGINLSQASIGWRSGGWVDVTLGKMANPLYTTAMVWDPDLNPEGAAERFKYTVGEADFFATFGQFVYQDTNPKETAPGFFTIPYKSSNLPFLLAWQGGVNYHLTQSVSLKVAPVLYNYTGHGINPQGTPPFVPDFSGNYVGQGSTNSLTGISTGASTGYPNGGYDGFTANQTGINDLLVLEIPCELNFKVDKLNVRLFGDYSQNLKGGQRAKLAYTSAQRAQVNTPGSDTIILIPTAQRHDTKAYQMGLAIGTRDSLGLVTGSACKKHAWEIRSYWQHVEQYALDPNLMDSDIFEGRGNMEGVFAAAAYAFTDNIIGTARYGHAARINKLLGTGGSNQDIPQMNPIEHYSLLQFDLTFRF